ncbi:hypothetical protein CDD83_335 [Cordyceps sp. RAO-2017]|nr:hypothetical protein CDD83_335 [Cordyceps sp. RAO-2017]
MYMCGAAQLPSRQTAGAAAGRSRSGQGAGRSALEPHPGRGGRPEGRTRSGKQARHHREADDDEERDGGSSSSSGGVADGGDTQPNIAGCPPPPPPPPPPPSVPAPNQRAQAGWPGRPMTSPPPTTTRRAGGRASHPSGRRQARPTTAGEPCRHMPASAVRPSGALRPTALLRHAHLGSPSERVVAQPAIRVCGVDATHGRPPCRTLEENETLFANRLLRPLALANADRRLPQKPFLACLAEKERMAASTTTVARAPSALPRGETGGGGG